jgi:hypothetical protein
MSDDNVIGIRQVPKSHRLPDGSAILTGVLDKVLFEEFEKQNKLLLENIEKSKRQHEQIKDLLDRESSEKNEKNLLGLRLSQVEFNLKFWRRGFYFIFFLSMISWFVRMRY